MVFRRTPYRLVRASIELGYYRAFGTFGSNETRPLGVGKTIKDLSALPGNWFEALMGDRKGQFSIRINGQWRICFEWPVGAPGPSNVEIVDYH